MTTRPSKSYPIFEQMAAELLLKLRPIGSHQSLQLQATAERFMATFREWTSSPPLDDDARVRSIQDLMSFVREANEFLAGYRSSPPPA